MTPQIAKAVGWWQLGCGLLGVAASIASWLDLPAGGRAHIEAQIGWMSFYLGCAFFSLTAIAGVRLIRGKPGAFGLAFLCELPQVASFAFLGGPQFVVACGPSIELALSSAKLGVSAGFATTFALGMLEQGPSYSVSVNVLALALTILLYRAWFQERPTPESAA